MNGIKEIQNWKIEKYDKMIIWKWSYIWSMHLKICLLKKGWIKRKQEMNLAEFVLLWSNDSSHNEIEHKSVDSI